MCSRGFCHRKRHCHVCHTCAASQRERNRSYRGRGTTWSPSWRHPNLQKWRAMSSKLLCGRRRLCCDATPQHTIYCASWCYTVSTAYRTSLSESRNKLPTSNLIPIVIPSLRLWCHSLITTGPISVPNQCYTLITTGPISLPNQCYTQPITTANCRHTALSTQHLKKCSALENVRNELPRKAPAYPRRTESWSHLKLASGNLRFVWHYVTEPSVPLSDSIQIPFTVFSLNV